MRRCATCMQSKPKQELLRIVYTENGLILDESGKANGRGVYLCRDPNCIRTCEKKNSLSRSLGRPLEKEDVKKVLSLALEAADGEKKEN